MSYTIAAFYRFAELECLSDLKMGFKAICEREGIQGTLLLAGEGINATLAGEDVSLQRVLNFIQSYSVFSNLDIKYAEIDFMPFEKMKVLVKKEIVTFGVPALAPHIRTGVHVSPKEWNDLVVSPDVLVLDTRNDYEVAHGTFPGAIDPKTQSFSDFPQVVQQHLDPIQHKKIAMFCTGGIRCEKASAYLLQQGFENVYQLQGGILNYLAETDVEKSLWQGECFIFDQRVTVSKESIRKGHSTNTPCAS